MVIMGYSEMRESEDRSAISTFCNQISSLNARLGKSERRAEKLEKDLQNLTKNIEIAIEQIKDLVDEDPSKRALRRGLRDVITTLQIKLIN